MKYICSVCGYVYDEALGIPERGIPAGTKWEELPENWKCPLCGAAKSMFRPEEGTVKPAPAEKKQETFPEDEMREVSFGELSAMCSSLALGCDKQQLSREKELFGKLAGYFEGKAGTQVSGNTDELLKRINENLAKDFVSAKEAAAESGDRGAKRILTWSEKVTALLRSLLEQWKKDGSGFAEKTSVYVCDICGFVYVGDVPPAVCPICKVPSFKILKVERR